MGLLWISACATTPKQAPQSLMPLLNSAQWETKAIVKNPKQGKVNSLTIDIMAVREQRARFEISAVFGVQVASLVMNQQEISFIDYQHKNFYFGKNSERAFSNLINLPLHPMNLSYIAFDQPVRGQGWLCKTDGGGWIESCKNEKRALEVKWTDRNKWAKRVVITGPDFEMLWYFKEPQTSVQFKPTIFTLSQPEGFKAIQIH